MKTRFNRDSKRSGSVLVITLILAVILGTTLGGYLMWVRSQTALVAESQAWNAALALAEAGIEEGMAQLNVAGTNFVPSAQTNFGSLSGGVYGPRVNNNMTGGSYSVTIGNDYPPTVTAVGTTKVNYMAIPISRTVRVRTTTQAPFANAISALRNVDMTGAKIVVDSYDSLDPAHSTGGLYDFAKRKAGGDVSTTEGIINVQNAEVYGKLRTAPWLGSSDYTIGPNGRVGDLPANWPNTTGIEDGWYKNDYNATFADVFDPTVSTLPPAAGSGTNTWELITSTYYIGGDFTIKNNQVLHVSGNATLWVTGNFTMQSQNGSLIAIEPGASLRLYVGTATGSAVSTTLTTVNTGGSGNNAYNFQYYGLPSNTSITWSGNATFIGCVYAPEAAFTLDGGGSTTSDYQGSCVVKSVTMKGRFNVHYDENLKRAVFPIGWTVASWQEL